ncbi:MAG: undecaprenyldiphospho-muramoylpentapeptide beta-N-acetylglucosaminyltransferase [Alphaproteobacteria bacterium]|nr:undecaprenyldiphospho-muramoylpentapeptide beta-N-acetylglucosaminyltransferase [Alphaproteobacteria bacterium]
MKAVPQRLVVLATGGTGGHLFPAAALAEVLAARGCALALFTDRREVALPPALSGLPIERLPAKGVAGRGLPGRVLAVGELAFGTWKASRRLRHYRPAAVVGFGGYASVPTVLAAGRAGIPTVLHEQNAVIGRANRVAAGKARAVCTSFEVVAGLAANVGSRTIRTGNPVRAAIAALRDQPYPTPIPGGPLSLFVTGGSQGARVFGDIVPAAVALLPEAQRQRLKIVQQCRQEQLEATQAAYAAIGVGATLQPFFPDMAGRLGDAHLLVGRSGATTVAELTCAGRPAILVPYPYATDDHQTANAQALAAGGGAWLMPQDGFTPHTLAAMLQRALDDPSTLVEAASCARALGIADAAERLAGVVEQFLPATNGNAKHGETRLEAAQ